MLKQSRIKENILKLLFFIISIFLFNGCLSNNYNIPSNNHILKRQHTYNNLQLVTSNISEQLFNTINDSDFNNSIIITSFVSLNNLQNTTQLGRILGENMISQLHERGFNVVDFRGRDSILVNKNGEFYITRDTSRLKDEIPNANILVGTYSKYNKNSFMINARIMDLETGSVKSSANIVYSARDCTILNICQKSNRLHIIKAN